jgi:hypothetical protein
MLPLKNCPGRQFTGATGTIHAVRAALDAPVEQFRQSVKYLAPILLLYFPAGHIVHVVDATVPVAE